MVGYRTAMAAIVAGTSVAFASAQTGSSPLLARVDHLVYAAPDVTAAVDRLYERIGIRASPSYPSASHNR